MAKIDKITIKKKRAEIIFDGEVYQDINLETLAKYKYKVGQETDYSSFFNFVQESEALNAKESLIMMLSRGPKTESEAKKKLYEKGYHKASIENAIAAAKEYGYLSDDNYAKLYTNMKAPTKGKMWIKFGLRNKGVDDEVINQAISSISVNDEIETCTKLAKRFLDGDLNDPKVRDKLMRRLAYRGFNFDVVKCALQNLGSCDDEFYD